MPRYFTLQQAESVLPYVEAAIREAIRLKSVYVQAEVEFRELTRKVMISGGMNVDRAAAAELKNAREESAAQLQSSLEKIQEFGCQVKDLDIGLLDFPTLYRGREVLLCWKLGETGIAHWHGTEEGFRGRKPIDEEFLQNHRGDAVS